MPRLEHISDHLIREGILRHPLEGFQPVGGGCINDCYRARSGEYTYFLKINSASAYPGMFAAEAEGLRLLHDARQLRVPEVLDHGETDNSAYLLMEFIESGRRAESYWRDSGVRLAQMHRITADSYGLKTDNYIGSLVQYNGFLEEWPHFFLERRIIPQLEFGVEAGWASGARFREAERLARRIEQEFPAEPPSLLHGDLWSGNIMTDREGQPVIVDPAVYFGNREMEIAFTKMFGGFGPEFYEGYESVWPLEPDFRKRAPVHNLYPLMVHANLFGGHYVQEVLQFLRTC